MAPRGQAHVWVARVLVGGPYIDDMMRAHQLIGRLDEDDVVAEVERRRREDGKGLSEAVNELIRAGLAQHERARSVYEHRATSLGLRVDVSNIGDVLDLLDD